MSKRRPRRPLAPPRPRAQRGMPLVLYVERGAEDVYFGRNHFDTIDDGAVVGVYELRETRTLKITRGLR